MGELRLKPVFVQNKNVRNFLEVMGALERTAGEGRMACIYSRAGRGKTRTTHWYHAQHDSVYVRVLQVWRTSELDFLRTLARELGIKAPPARKGPCFAEVLDRLVERPVPVFLDEIEKLPASFLEIVRDLTDLSTAPFVLIGEEEIHDWMARKRRVWSRTFEVLEFQPLDVSDVVLYAREAAGAVLEPGAAAVLHRASAGDFRIIKRDLAVMLRMANAKKTDRLTEEMARQAVRAGMRGK